MSDKRDLQLKVAAQLRRMGNGNVHAAEWLIELWKVTAIWDHIRDGDDLNREHACRAFEMMMLHWPVNPFLVQHSTVLVPIIANAVAAWEWSNTERGERIKSGDILTETAGAVALLTGGLAFMKEQSPILRDLIKELLRRDDQEEVERRASGANEKG